MALTFTKLSPSPDHVCGNKRHRYRTVLFDAAYPDGGEAITASDFGLKSLEAVEIVGGALVKTDEEQWYSVAYDYTGKKLVVNGFDYSNASDGPGLEADNAGAPDLSAFEVVVKAVGW